MRFQAATDNMKGEQMPGEEQKEHKLNYSKGFITSVRLLRNLKCL